MSDSNPNTDNNNNQEDDSIFNDDMFAPDLDESQIAYLEKGNSNDMDTK